MPSAFGDHDSAAMIRGASFPKHNFEITVGSCEFGVHNVQLVLFVCSFLPSLSLHCFPSFVFMLIGFERALFISFVLRSRRARGHCGSLVPL